MPMRLTRRMRQRWPYFSNTLGHKAAFVMKARWLLESKLFHCLCKLSNFFFWFYFVYCKFLWADYDPLTVYLFLVVLMWLLLCWQGDGAADPNIDNEESQEASDSIQKQADSQSSGTKTHTMHSFLNHSKSLRSLWLFFKKVLSIEHSSIENYSTKTINFIQKNLIDLNVWMVLYTLTQFPCSVHPDLMEKRLYNEV